MQTTATISEADAARAALSGTPRERARIATRALLGLLRDPDDTRQVFLLGLVANGRAFPGFFARFASTDDGARLLAERPSIDGTTVARLRGLPADTLGGAYARYLDDNGLDADLFQAPPGLPEPIRYVAQRLRQTHDIWHVLTGYLPDVPGEVALQGFTYAQLGAPSAALIAGLGALRWAPSRPDIVPMTRDGYRRGKQAAFLAPVRWEALFERQLEEVRRELRISPAKARPRASAPS